MQREIELLKTHRFIRVGVHKTLYFTWVERGKHAFRSKFDQTQTSRKACKL